MKKGIWYMIEAILASVILILFLVALGTQHVAKPATDITPKGYEMLKDVDKQGKLRSYVIDENCTGLDSEIEWAGYNHSIQIYDYQGNVVCGAKPNASNVYVSVYLISGKDEYQPYEIILYLW